MFEEAGKLWVIHIGNNNEAALRARDEGFVCIGWAETGDLGSLTTRDEFRDALRKTYPDWTDPKIFNNAGQVYRFAREIQVGDPIVLPVKPTREIAIGRVTGAYRYDMGDGQLVGAGYPNVRSVEWLKVVPRTLFSQKALYSFGAFLTVSTANDHLDETIEVLKGRETPPPSDLDEGDALTSGEDGARQEDLYDQARQLTEDFLLKQWLRTGAAFEHVVAAVLEALGYTARVTRASGDKGVDVIAHPDRLGLERPLLKVQAKSGTSSVGGPTVQQLKGTLHPGEKGMLVTLGSFTTDALAAASGSADIVVLDAQEFVKLFLDVYEKLDPKWRARFPLRHVYVPEA